MDLTKGKEKIQGLLNRIRGLLPEITAKFTLPKLPIAKLFLRHSGGKRKEQSTKTPRPISPGALKSALTGKINALRDRFTDRFPEGKRRPVLFVFGGVVVLFIILLITVLARNSREPGKNVPVQVSAGPVIPADEFLIPGEPDFLPDFLLERTPRRSWSLEDIRPYWKNPADSDRWREEVKSAVDKLMETVP